ncbi:hypothetical protein GCM10025768_02920 [Microbacterium pseudoresistens]
MSASGILTVRFEVDPEGEAMVNRWYDEVHIAERLAVPKFTGIRRYRSLVEPLEHLAIWDVEDASWPFDLAYRAIPTELWRDRLGHLRGKSTRIGWEEISTTAPPRPNPADATAPGIRMVLMEIPPQHAADFNEWYDQDHIPELLKRPQYLGIRRFHRLDSDDYLAVWYLTDGGLHLRPNFVPAEPTEWGRRVAGYRRRTEHSSWLEIPTVLSKHDS